MTTMTAEHSARLSLYGLTAAKLRHLAKVGPTLTAAINEAIKDYVTAASGIPLVAISS